ncbi:MAG: hypothetical protein FJ265_19175 [Planctomycetes bacterium]|nr:hypothetical protein [Planctomycetota bacterium]
MTSSRSRRVLIAAAAAIFTVLGAAGVVQMQAGAAWSAMQRTADGLEADWRGRDHRREVLWGESSPGSAFAGYTEALRLAAGLSRDQQPLVSMLPHDDDAKVAGARPLLASWRPALAALHRAAHCSDARRPTPGSTPGPGQDGLVSLLHARWLVNVAVLQARAQRLAGEPRAAVESALDAAAFGADLVRGGVLIDAMIGVALVQIATHEAWPEAALRQLGAPALELLAAGLERLDASLPERLPLDGELRFMARELQRAGALDGYGAAAWRFGFSSRWMLADAFLDYVATADRLQGEPQLSWPQREAWLELELGTLAEGGNPVGAVLAPHLTTAERSLRLGVAHARLLRTAVALHRGLDVPPLRDPLGDGPFAVVRDAEGVLLRCAGEVSGKRIERRVVP